MEKKIKAQTIAINELTKSDGDKVALKKLQDARLACVLDLLEKDDPDFTQVWNRNLDLLATEKLNFRVDREAEKSFTIYSSSMDGTINNFGALVLESDAVDGALIKFANYRYPISFYGRIDALGRVEIQVDERAVSLSGRDFPTAYDGSITNNGVIKLSLKSKTKEYLGAGKVCKIVCNPIFRNTLTEASFMKNREILLNKAKQIILNFEQELST